MSSVNNSTISNEQNKTPHSLIEDLLAIVTGTLVVSFGIMLLRHAGAITGGTAGIGFLMLYISDIPFGVWFFTLNLPFYYLSIKQMGWAFTLKTFLAVALVSVFAEIHPYFIHLEPLNPFYATVIGGMLMGLGMLVLFRHKASLGGLNILALYLQEHKGIRAGTFQMCVDCSIIIASFFIVSIPILLASILGAFLLNLIIAMNHRPFRYLA
ncbi:YitT family protein [Neptunomonas phycophila]|uniref:YitT family protein n=1 Tax=Neptunomonas phycophila TaxID=1572645 RepID=A0AAW7XIE5_9GAMM|nr:MULTISPECIES: YitT family protein [Neptunomonas]MBT3144875.1 YitT family protein [Neptunomonas phycophila]MDN2658370.1 YitT family protein [Neptunomonas sp. CHC150]MDO6454196.1 YitT family protein [Neptunomonas phycophila]MDO6468712.1 YitT family protein [Neptunomonas phycophila]MDP2523217.1 YitT family protein [Neptunomonas phycophila]